MRIFDITISIFIFLSSTFYMTGKEFGFAQGRVFEIGIPLLLLIALSVKPSRNCANLFINIIALFAYISVIFAQSTDSRLVGITPLVHVFEGLVLFYLVANYVSDVRYVIYAIGASACLHFLFCTMQMMKIDPLCLDDKRELNTHIVGLFGYKHALGIWASMATMVFLGFRKWAFSAVTTVLTFLSMSWAAIGALGLGVISAVVCSEKGFMKYAISFVIILSMLLAFYLFVNKRDNYILTLPYKLGTRIELEQKFLPYLFAGPHFGQGLDSFKYIGPSIVNNKNSNYGTMTDAWNDYLERGIEMGRYAFSYLALFVFYYARRFFIYCKRGARPFLVAGSIVCFFNMLFHSCFNIFNLSVMIIVLFGLMERELQGEGI